MRFVNDIYVLCFQDATHTVVFSQLEINGVNQGVHAFIAQIREANGNICQNVRIADCGHKVGLNGVDDGRIWYIWIEICKNNIFANIYLWTL